MKLSVELALPSGFFVASAIDSVGSVGPSSSAIVPVAWASRSVALLGLDRSTVKVSVSASSAVSPTTGTSMVLLVWPAVKVSVPLVVV